MQCMSPTVYLLGQSRLASHPKACLPSMFCLEVLWDIIDNTLIEV